MFDASFSHYLSYGATDQQTLRDLTGHYSGVVVPGTVAAFQAEGTGGFVLTLSATVAAPPYVIDSRFPLFQQALRRPKQSHLALAELLDAPDLVRDTDPDPHDFSSNLIETIAGAWSSFNLLYRDARMTKFDKYARRLNEEVTQAQALRPELVLAPYAAAASVEDAWWDVSKRLFDATHAAVGGELPTRRVVAAKETGGLGELIQDVADEQVVVWVSGLDELTAGMRRLVEYARAVSAASEAGRTVFALYGGFFSVLLSAVGLCGSSHGVGYGEYRNWVELPQSGPPPARYYLPRVHRYVSQELAYQLWLKDRWFADCPCPECDGEPPIALEYHALMRHSVFCRELEIVDWSGRSAAEIAAAIRGEADEFRTRLYRADVPEYVERQAQRAAAHLEEWQAAFSELA